MAIERQETLHSMITINNQVRYVHVDRAVGLYSESCKSPVKDYFYTLTHFVFLFYFPGVALYGNEC